MGIFLAGCLAVGTRLNPPDPDTWAHVATGGRILSTHTWPKADTYSFTADHHEQPDGEWLGAVVIALAARVGGLRAMAALFFLLESVFIGLLYYLAYLRSSNPKAAFLACLAVSPIAFNYLNLRPQLLGYSLFLCMLVCLERFRQGGEKTLWLLPPLFAIWVNADGTFIAGLLVLGLYLASGLVSTTSGGIVAERWTTRRRRGLLRAILLSLLALCLTPYGTGIAGHAFSGMFRAHTGISEIAGFGPLSGNGFLLRMFLVLFLPFLLAQVIFWPSYRLDEVMLFVVAVYAACVHTRFVFLLIAAFTPMLAVLLARWVPQYTRLRDRPALNAILGLLVVGGVWWAFPSERALDRVISERFPQQAAAYLRGHAFDTAMLNESEWGGYLIWALPEHKVFIDGRTHLYEDSGVLADYLSIVRAETKTLSLLRKYDLQACLVKRGSPLETILATAPGWTQAYSDDVSTIIVRERAP